MSSPPGPVKRSPSSVAPKAAQFMTVASADASDEALPDTEILPAGLRTRLVDLEQRLNHLLATGDVRGREDLAAERTTVKAALDAIAGETSPIPTPESAGGALQRKSNEAPPTPDERQMLEVIYTAFASVGDWPCFQHVTAHTWERLQRDPREVYHQLSEHDFVHPPVTARRDFQLREDTQVSVSLLGLTYLRAAIQDIANFVFAVRYIAERAVRFRPSTPTEVEHLTITSEEIRLKLSLAAGDPSLLRLGALLREEAWSLRQTFSSQATGPWSMTVIPETARHYRDVHTIIEFMALRAGPTAGP